MFCWASQSQFRKFARKFDGYDARGAEGYTRSVERNGHVHVVLLRNGRTPEDFDRFACTLVHEGTHAFVHRLGGTRLIPHWINEGLAERTADRVLGERCPCRGNAVLLASEVARRGWSLGGLLENSGPIEVQSYAAAHSVIDFLESLEPGAFAEFIFALKRGDNLDVALNCAFGGMTVAALEAQWRAWAQGQAVSPSAMQITLQTGTPADR